MKGAMMRQKVVMMPNRQSGHLSGPELMALKKQEAAQARNTDFLKKLQEIIVSTTKQCEDQDFIMNLSSAVGTFRFKNGFVVKDEIEFPNDDILVMAKNNPLAALVKYKKFYKKFLNLGLRALRNKIAEETQKKTFEFFAQEIESNPSMSKEEKEKWRTHILGEIEKNKSPEPAESSEEVA